MNEALSPSSAARGELLGTVTAPSGSLRVLDCGMYAWLTDATIPEIPAIEVSGIPVGTPLEVRGWRVAPGSDASRWDRVAVVADAEAVVSSRELLGEAMVDWARLMIADARALAAWEHEEPLDGRADFVFWGRDAGLLAAAMGAPELDDGHHGWLDLEVHDCAERGKEVEGLKASNGWLLATDFRPHSHHYRVLEQIRSTPTESGTVEVGGAEMCAFMTTWGDGLYPVFRDLDRHGQLVQLRIQLAPDASRDGEPITSS